MNSFVALLLGVVLILQSASSVFGTEKEKKNEPIHRGGTDRKEQVK